jgi:hypothetical protein
MVHRISITEFKREHWRLCVQNAAIIFSTGFVYATNGFYVSVGDIYFCDLEKIRFLRLPVNCSASVFRNLSQVTFLQVQCDRQCRISKLSIIPISIETFKTFFNCIFLKNLQVGNCSDQNWTHCFQVLSCAVAIEHPFLNTDPQRASLRVISSGRSML